MFVHIGNDFAVRDKDIVGVFDIENTSTVAATKDFLSNGNKDYISVTYDEPNLCGNTGKGKRKGLCLQNFPFDNH